MLTINKKNIDSLFSKAFKDTKNGMLVYIDDNWSDTAYVTTNINGDREIRYDSSAPGSPPAIQSGDLRKSIKGNSNKDGVVIYSNEEYSVYLELGTKDIEPRPFFRPALNQAFPLFVSSIRKYLK